MDKSVLARLLGSRKVWVAFAAVVGILAVRLGWGGDADAIAGSIAALGIAVVAAIGYEDGNAKRAAPVTADNATVVQNGGTANVRVGPSDHTPSTNVLAWLLLMPALCLLAAAGGCAGPAPAYVAADRETYNALAPEYGDYVDRDLTLSPEQKARRNRTVETWRIRLEAAERSAAAPASP